MNYLRPIPDDLDQRPHTLTLTQSVDYSIFDKISGDTIFTRINIVVINSELDKDGNMYAKSIGKIPEEYVSAIYNHLIAKKDCSHYGELINQRLLSFLISYIHKQKKTFLKKGFMTLRDNLSDIIKTDKRFYTIDELNTQESRESFRKLFAQFIEDRNIYTHGSLVYRINDNKILIHCIEKNRTKYSYFEVNIRIMSSYVELFKYLNNILDKLGNKLGELSRSNSV